MDLGIADKTAVVLAAGGGLGGAIAERLSAEGATVVAWDIDGAALKSLGSRVEAAGGKPIGAVEVDLHDPGSIDDALEQTARVTSQRPQILVNITGGPPPCEVTAIPADTWLGQFRAMVLSVVKVTDALMPSMQSAGWGRVVTSASSGVIAPIDNLGLSNALRSSLIGWSKTLANEVAGSGVTVNVVVPGRIATARIRSLDEAKATRAGTTIEEIQRASTGSIPVGRYGEPEEYAAAVAFLVSRWASYITGTMLRVDGGLVPTI